MGRLLSGIFRLLAVWGIQYVPSMLSWGDIQVDHPSYQRIVLRQSKTDLFGAGVTLFVGATGDTLCPVAAVPYSGYISSEFNFVLFVLILFEQIYSERKFNVGVTASSGHVV